MLIIRIIIVSILKSEKTITRWNSWLKLLDAAISQEGPLSVFVNQYHRELEDDTLTHDDWQVLKMTHEFLQPFRQATMEQQMAWASIDQVLENMDILFVQFEDAKVGQTPWEVSPLG